uniref:Wsv306-like protein n=1 Tax=Penaeus monodon majanivirus B TaxID=2984272 RepID=A0A9C7EY75_9VIRU|nr:MAG: wsv306-like protein [Penaeus monodon majanivirus B]
MNISHQSHIKPNCTTVDIFCTDDKDCHVQCGSSALSILSHTITPEKDDHSVVTVYLCNKSTKRCEPNVVLKGFYDMAMNDLNRLLKRKSALSKGLQSYLHMYDGKYFILARARFYESLSLHLHDNENLEMAIRNLRSEHQRKRKTYLYEKIRYLENKGIITDKDEVKKMIGWLSFSQEKNNSTPVLTSQNAITENTTITMDVYKQHLFGHHIPQPPEDTTVLTRAREYDDRRCEYIQKMMSVMPKQQNRHQRGEYFLKPTTTTTTTTLELDEEPTSSIRSPSKDLQFHCNEEMGAGIMMAAFRDDDGIILPVCICTHPMYLTGPTCKHRTYNSVIDYAIWEETGIPEFLTDPFNDYTKANDICKRTTANTTAVFDEREGTFKCQPLAAHIGQSLQLRGPYEPALILDRDYIDTFNANHRQRFKINVDYLDLIGKFW